MFCYNNSIHNHIMLRHLKKNIKPKKIKNKKKQPSDSTFVEDNRVLSSDHDIVSSNPAFSVIANK